MKQLIIIIAFVFISSSIFSQINPIDSINNMISKDINMEMISDTIPMDSSFFYANNKVASKIEFLFSFIDKNTEIDSEGMPLAQDAFDFENITYRLICTYKLKELNNFEAVQVNVGIKKKGNDLYSKKLTVADKPNADYPFGLLLKEGSAVIIVRDFKEPISFHIELIFEHKDGKTEVVYFDPDKMY